MPQKESEAIVLRTYPMREADLLVTLFTRSEGKVRGVARSAMKSKKRFGGALEPLTVVRVYWHDKQGIELARLDSCDILRSPLTSAVDYARAAALAHVAEVLDELLPDREANDTAFRLAASVLTQLVPGSIWMPLTYFDLWIVRLMGFLPELTACTECGEPLDGQRAFWHARSDGLMCVDHRKFNSTELSSESRRIAALMFRAPVEAFAGEAWSKSHAADLRKFCVQTMQRHIERRLATMAALDKIS